MKIVDFGQNLYQYLAEFKFSCISTQLTREIVDHFLTNKKYFSDVGKEDSATVLISGKGTAEAPFFQLRIGPDTLAMWAGWHAKYDKWIEWRKLLISEISEHLSPIPIEFIRSLVSQYLINVPIDRIKPAKEVPELESVLGFYARFVPEKFLDRVGAAVLFGDQEGNESVEWWFGESKTPGYQNLTFHVRKNILETESSLRENMLSHSDRSDKIFELFHAGFLSLLVRAP